MTTRILVVRAGALGDTLMATPVIAALRKRYASAAIDFLCAEPAAPLLAHHPDIARVLPLRQRNWPYWLSIEKRRLVGRARHTRYDFAIVLEGAPRYYDLVRRAGIGRILGFHLTPFDPGLHAVANNLRAAGFGDWAGSALDMSLQTSPDEDTAAAQLLGDFQGPLIGLHAAPAAQRGKKNQGRLLKGWPVEHFATLARQLVQRGLKLILIGSSDDRAPAAEIGARLPDGSFLNLVGRTGVAELAALIRRLRLLVAVDSGPAHMAAALGTPLVVLWGPAILEQVAPLSSSTPIRIVRHPVYCAPCYNTALMKTCRRNICMEGITPEQVLGAIDELQLPLDA